MSLIELISCSLRPAGGRHCAVHVDLTLKRGEVCALEADSPEEALLLMRTMATLVHPVSGEFRFDGERLDFTDYRRLLATKRRIGYVARDAAMLSNRTLRQNLLTMRYYFEDSLRIRLDPAAENLCALLGISGELDRTAAEVDKTVLNRAVAVREAGKSPALMLLHRPEELLGRRGFRRFWQAAGNLVPQDCAWLCDTQDRAFIEARCSRRLRIRSGALS